MEIHEVISLHVGIHFNYELAHEPEVTLLEEKEDVPCPELFNTVQLCLFHIF